MGLVCFPSSNIPEPKIEFVVDKWLVEDERQNLCGKSLLLWCVYPYSEMLPVGGRVWAWLDPSAWCWELVSKCLRSKAPWCEIASDHWLKMKCLQENQPRQITTGPNLQVTVVMPQRPLTPVFRVYSSSWQIAHMDIRYLCKPVPSFPQGTFQMSWVGVSHWCIFRNFGPCSKQGKDYLGSWLCPDMLRRGGALQALLHKSQSYRMEYSQAHEYPAKPWACAPVLLMGFADGVASSSALPPWPEIFLLNSLECFSELLKAIFLLGNAISIKPCRSNGTWRSTAQPSSAEADTAHCPIPLEWVVCWLDSLAWSLANLWP